MFTGQATVYVVRESQHFWTSRPGRTLLLASLADVVAVSLLALMGILMAPVSPILVLLVFVLSMVFMTVQDMVKMQVFRRIDVV